MSNFTILKPTWSAAATAKVFELEPSTRRVKNVSSYQLGKTFTYAETTVKDIPSLYSVLDKCKDKKVFRIYGRPIDGLDKEVRRKKDNFICEATNLLMLDADEWEVPPGFSITTEVELHKTINEILVNRMGLTALDGVQYCCLLSSSSWKKTHLRAHLYFLLDEQVLLADLHTWGFNHNTLLPEYKMDYSLFRQVQPDYISRRICQGFKDPLSDSLRLTKHCDHLSPYVEKAGLMKHINDTNQKSGQDPNDPTNALVTQVPIAKTWEKTLELCGTVTHGINEPAFRACAQLVQEIGDTAATNDIVFHVNQVHLKMWAAITGHGIRGNKADRDNYNREKVKGYILTAVNKKFGEEADLVTRSITDAISAIKNGGNPSLIFSRDCLESIHSLRTKMPERWMNLRGVIKRELKGVVSIAELEKASSSEDKLDVELMVDTVLDKFKWIEGENDNCLYCMVSNGENYKLLALDDGVEEEIYTTAFSLFAGKMPIYFERTALRVLLSRHNDPIFNPFTIMPVESRCYSTVKNKKSVVYYNLGTSHDGLMTTAIITEDGIEVVPSSVAPVMWKYSNNILMAELADFKAEIDLLGEMGKDLAIDRYLKGLRNFSSVSDEEDLVELAAWQTVAVVNTGTANLLQITGASNDGKSTTALFVKELCDPTSACIREGPDLHSGLYKKEDMAKTLRSRHVTIFDNLSKIPPREQDMLCSVATGWRYDLRLMYSQRYLSLVIKRPIILTSLAPVVTNQDLRSRAMSVLVDRGNKKQTIDMFDKWDEENGDLRVGLFFFISEVLKRMNARRRRRANMNDRDLWGNMARVVASLKLGLVNGAPKTEDQLTALVGGRQRFENANEAMLNSRTCLMVAWIANDKTFRRRRALSLTSQEGYIKFKKFVNEHAGLILDAYGYQVEIAPRDMVENVRSFSTKIGMSANDIKTVTGWECRNVRDRGKRTWRFLPVTEKEVTV